MLSLAKNDKFSLYWLTNEYGKEGLQQEFLKFLNDQKSASMVEQEKGELYIYQYREVAKYQKYLINPSLLNSLGLRELDKINYELNAINAAYSPLAWR